MGENKPLMRNFKRNFKSPVFWLLASSITLTLVSLVVYLAGTELPDQSLFFLLSILRFSSFAALVCSLYRLLIFIYYIYKWIFARIKYKPIKRIGERKRKRRILFIKIIVFGILKFLFYFVLIALCFGILFFQAFITEFSGGTT